MDRLHDRIAQSDGGLGFFLTETAGEIVFEERHGLAKHMAMHAKHGHGPEAGHHGSAHHAAREAHEGGPQNQEEPRNKRQGQGVILEEALWIRGRGRKVDDPTYQPSSPGLGGASGNGQGHQAPDRRSCPLQSPTGKGEQRSGWRALGRTVGIYETLEELHWLIYRAGTPEPHRFLRYSFTDREDQ